MAARRLVIMAMMLIMLVAAVEAKDQCEEKCDKQCATHPFFPQCIRVCLIRCRRPPPPTAYSLCTLGCIDSFCTKIGSDVDEVEGCEVSCSKKCTREQKSLARMAAMGENGARRLAVMVMTLVLLAAAVAQADTDCSRKCVRQCRDSLFPTICRQGCLKKCKHSFSDPHFGCTLGCTYSKCTNLGFGI
ncbi:hypothetical protein AAG906_023687 [Vitis piasezkii]